MTVQSSLLFGRSRTRSRQYVFLAVGLFLGTLGLLGVVWVVSRQEVSVPISGAWALWIAAIITVGTPALQAYQNDGLLVSLLLGLPVPLAFYLVLTTFTLVYPSEDVLWGVGAALQFGVPAGLLGFVLGAGTRRVRERRTAAQAESGTP